MDDNRTRSFDCMCGKSYITKNALGGHELKCKMWLDQARQGYDFVKCAICGVAKKNLKHHVEKSHGIDKKDYEQQHGSTLCEKSCQIKSKLQNWNWVARAKENNPEKYHAWKEKLGPTVSKGIMASPSARKARKENFVKLNKTPTARQRSSEVAKITSARPEILKQRSDNLARWREENPEDFYNKCTAAMHKTWHSKPEIALFNLICELFPGRFKRNQQIRRIQKFKTVKSGKRQIDILDKENKIVVEFDGIHHFKNVFKSNDSFLKTTQRDKELNRVLPDEGFVLIRVSHDQYHYRQGGHFDVNCIKNVVKLIKENKPGLYLIGSLYEGNDAKNQKL